MSMHLLQFLGGLGLLLGGGVALVRGAASIASGLGVPPVAVGLTVVAFGTSAPEFVVGATGALTGFGGVAFGNAVGANIVNIAFILGLTATVAPLAVHPTIVTRELPMLLLATLAALVISIDAWLGAGPNRLERGDGLMLILLFCVFLYYTVMTLRRNEDDTFVREAQALDWQIRVRAVVAPVGLAVLGLLGLAVGGNLVVDAAVRIADRLGMPPAAIALTIVSVGTTLPELAISLIAARKGEADLAIGNLVGSNIFNILMVLGAATLLRPMDVPDRGPLSLAIATALTLLLVVLVRKRQPRVTRVEGLVLLASFVGYLAWVSLA